MGSGLINGKYGALDIIGGFIGIAVAVAITGYLLWVVYAFMEEIKLGQRAGNVEGVGATGTVHYVPKESDNPPAYGQPGAVYPLLPVDNNPYQETTTKN